MCVSIDTYVSAYILYNDLYRAKGPGNVSAVSSDGGGGAVADGGIVVSNEAKRVDTLGGSIADGVLLRLSRL